MRSILDRIEATIPYATEYDPGGSCSIEETKHLVAVARAAQAIDLREQDIPVGPTRVAIHELHLALAPLLEELPE